MTIAEVRRIREKAIIQSRYVLTDTQLRELGCGTDCTVKELIAACDKFLVLNWKKRGEKAK